MGKDLGLVHNTEKLISNLFYSIIQWDFWVRRQARKKMPSYDPVKERARIRKEKRKGVGMRRGDIIP